MHTITDHVLEARGACQIVERFSDSRLRNLWRTVWRQVPASAIDAVYAALGAGGALLVTDENKANRPSNGYGQVQRIGEGLRMFLDYFNLDDASPAQARYIVAHELAHIVCGHVGAPVNEFDLSPAGQLEVLRGHCFPSSLIRMSSGTVR